MGRNPHKYYPGRLIIKGRHGAEYHYVSRADRRRFWKTGEEGRPGYFDRPGCAIYHAKWTEAVTGVPPRARLPHTDKGRISELIDLWLDSPRVQNKAPETLRHYRRWAERFREEFGDASFAVFNDYRIRADVIAWRDRYKDTPRQADYGATVAHMIITFGADAGHCANHLIKIPKLYHSNRAELVWTPDLIRIWQTGTNPAMCRVMDFMTLFGPRPQDAIRANRANLMTKDGMRFLVFHTKKRKRVATIPITGARADWYETLPPGQMQLIVRPGGDPWRSVRQLSDAFTAISRAKKIEKLQLRDTRGTAATRQFIDGDQIEDIAANMGWAPDYANKVIENYVALVPEVAMQATVARLRRKEK
ncbi:MAG: hypothetical protein AAF678_12340 [Pseudomonadota bacterium]